MKKKALLVAILLVAGTAGVALSHCEIPCGIYNDRARVDLIREDIDTVEKSMAQITELSAAEKPNWNQITRWVSNKEDHAGKIQHIVTQYFMTQRVKVPAAGDDKAQAKYVTQLTSLHQLLLAAMKMKQTTDQAWCAKARKLLDGFSGSYFGK